MARRWNCWLIAMWFWFHSHGRQWSMVRRSHAFKGWIPHFGYAEAHGWRHVKFIEYVPPKNRRWRRNGDWVLLFPGHYRVTHLRVMAVRQWATREQAEADCYQFNAKEIS